MVTFLTAKRAKVRKEAPQRNAFTPFLCGVFALSAAFAVIVTFVTAKHAMDRKEAPQRNAFTPIILIYFPSVLPVGSVRSPTPCHIISKYLLFSQSVTTLLNCLHSQSRVAVKWSTNSAPNSSLAMGDSFIAWLAIQRLEGSTP